VTIKYKKASVAFKDDRNTVSTLQVGYIILWTEEDYEVTVFSSNPTDGGTEEFIARFFSEDPKRAEAKVDEIIRCELLSECRQMVTIEEGVRWAS
jgi:hypothetical protein